MIFTRRYIIIFVVIADLSVMDLSKELNNVKFEKQQVHSYSKCWDDSECKENAFCYGNDDTFQGNCKCKNGFELIRNATFYECLPGVQLGKPCTKDIQCQITASKLAGCNPEKICSCNSMSNEFQGTCHLSVKLDDVCKSNGNCLLSNGNHVSCHQGHCTCPLGKRPSTDKKLCILDAKLGETCIHDEECSSTPNARCEVVCRCGSGFVQSRKEAICVKAATKFGENCSYDAQCSKYLTDSICLSNEYCGCDTGTHSYGIKCVKTAMLGEKCQEDAECIFELKYEGNIECKNHKCECIYGVGSDGMCKIEKVFGSSSPIVLPRFLIASLFWVFILIII